MEVQTSVQTIKTRILTAQARILGLSGAGLFGLVVKVLGALLSFAFMLVVTRLTGVEGWGQFSICFSVSLLLGTIAKLGMDTSMLRFTASAMATRQFSRWGSAFQKALVICLVLSVALAFGLFFGAPWLASAVFHKPTLYGYLQLSALWLPPWVLLFLLSEVLRGFGRPILFLFLQGVLPFLFAIGTMLPFLLDTTLFVGVDGPILGYLGGLMLAGTSAAGLVLWLAKVHKPGIRNSFALKRLTNLAFPIFATSLFQIVLGWADTLLLGIWQPVEDVGIYTTALRLSNLVLMPLLALGGMAAPVIAGCFAVKDNAGMQIALKGSSKAILRVTIPLYLALALGAPFVLSIFSEGMVAGAGVLVLLATGQLFNAFCGANDVVLQMTGGERFHRNIVGMAMVTNLVLNCLLIPPFGIMGAAIANVVANALWNVLALRRIKQQFGLWMIGF